MASSGNAIRFKLFDGFGLCVHSVQDPSKEEWNTYVATISGARPPPTRYLVYSAGGGPNVLQRKQLTAAFKTIGEPYVAIVSHSAIVRNITTAFNFVIDRRMRAFKPGELAEAIQTLDLSPRQQSELINHLVRFGAEIGIKIDPEDARRTPNRSATP